MPYLPAVFAICMLHMVHLDLFVASAVAKMRRNRFASVESEIKDKKSKARINDYAALRREAACSSEASALSIYWRGMIGGL